MIDNRQVARHRLSDLSVSNHIISLGERQRDSGRPREAYGAVIKLLLVVLSCKL